MKIEIAIYIAALLGLSGMVGLEGKRNVDLQQQLSLSPTQVYARLAKSKVKYQIVDAREDLEEYEDTHLPGAIPFPGCDPAKAPDAAKDRVYRYAPTIVVTENGDSATFDKCKGQFTTAWNMAGGLEAWVDADLPEDSGEYLPPKNVAGGGCL